MSIYEEKGLRRVINACGRMTKLGVSAVRPEAAAAMREAAQEYVVMDELFEWANRQAAKLFGCGGGCVCASASSGIFLTVASLLCGGDTGKIKHFHETVGKSRKKEIVMPIGHDVDYGAPVREIILLAGGDIRYAGYANGCGLADIEAKITEDTLAIFYVKSHHCVQKNTVGVYDVIAYAKEMGIPCIIDAAAEEDLEGYVKAGADYVVYSGSKAVCGPTSGMVLCREKKAADNMLLQYKGIGRLAKIGKENILGLMEALEQYKTFREISADGEYIQAITADDLERLAGQFNTLEGCHAWIHQDEAGRKIYRCRLQIEPEKTGYSARELSEKLKEGDPAIYVREYFVNQEILDIDPRPLKGKEELDEIFERIREIHKK